ncbi:MAG: hypothetical protein PHR75_04300 [Sulfurovum sp.]|nr:hypothetical protein [Sulfurovum sp.]MDD3602640.1 hypothetical protein [Sulfurovum sp.]
MDDEADKNAFTDYFKNYFLRNQQDMRVYMPWSQRDIVVQFIDSLSCCHFLEQVPHNDWDENISTLIKWAKSYYSKPKFQRKWNRKPTETRKLHINTLTKAKELIEQFLPKEITRITTDSRTTYIDFEPYPVAMNYERLKTLRALLQDAITDIEQQEFKVFPRDYYYDSATALLGELENILIGIAKKYSISHYSDEIRTLREMIPHS